MYTRLCVCFCAIPGRAQGEADQKPGLGPPAYKATALSLFNFFSPATCVSELKLLSQQMLLMDCKYNLKPTYSIFVY